VGAQATHANHPDRPAADHLVRDEAAEDEEKHPTPGRTGLRWEDSLEPMKDLKKVLAGETLSPVLVAEGDIADGYHRVSLAYALDPDTDVPLKLG